MALVVVHAERVPSGTVSILPATTSNGQRASWSTQSMDDSRMVPCRSEIIVVRLPARRGVTNADASSWLRRVGSGRSSGLLGCSCSPPQCAVTMKPHITVGRIQMRTGDPVIDPICFDGIPGAGQRSTAGVGQFNPCASEPMTHAGQRHQRVGQARAGHALEPCEEVPVANEFPISSPFAMVKPITRAAVGPCSATCCSSSRSQ
jgi:hypothetical protein